MNLRRTHGTQRPRYFNTERAFPVDITATADAAAIAGYATRHPATYARLFITASYTFALLLAWDDCSCPRAVIAITRDQADRILIQDGIAPIFASRARRAWQRARRQLHP